MAEIARAGLCRGAEGPLDRAPRGQPGLCRPGAPDTRGRRSRGLPAGHRRLTMIKVQREDFDVGRELDALTRGNARIGGVASFIGLVRDMGGADRVSALTLEHYPGMTERKLAEIEAEANKRWPLDASLII